MNLGLAAALLRSSPLTTSPPTASRLPLRAREYDQMPRDLRAHGSPQPEPRLLPSDPYTSPRGGDVVSHLVTLLSPEWARYPLPQHCSLSPTRVLAGTRQEHSYTRVSRRRGTPPPARPTRARSFSPPTTPLDLRAHGSPQPEPRLLPSGNLQLRRLGRLRRFPQILKIRVPRRPHALGTHSCSRAPSGGRRAAGLARRARHGPARASRHRAARRSARAGEEIAPAAG